MMLNRKIKCNMLIYAFFYPIYIYKLLKSELRLISYEINHFNMAFSKINANNNFKHFKCCYHDADDNFKFYALIKKMLIRAYYEAFVVVAENEKGATATIMEMVPRQR